MNEIGFEGFNDARALHFGQINAERNLSVERKGKALRVAHRKALVLDRQVLFRRFATHSQNIDFISCFLEELEHFFETVRVARNVSEWRGFHHQTDFARPIALEWGSIG